MFCYAINTAIVWFITRKWKISIHAIGLSGPLVALWLHGFHYPIIMGIALVLVCVSRVILKAHTPAQVIVGLGLGMSLAYFELTILF
jgi:membrane-associated phospholipid phosphatase